VLEQGGVVLLGELGSHCPVQKVRDVDDGTRDGEARNVNELCTDWPPAVLVVLEDDVAGVETAVDEDAKAAVVRVRAQFYQLPKEVLQVLFDRLFEVGGQLLLLSCVQPPAREVAHQLGLDSGDVRVEPLPETLGVDGKGKEVYEAHFAVPLDEGRDGVEVGHPAEDDATVVKVVEMLFLVAAVSGKGKVFEDEDVVLRVQLAEVAPGNGGLDAGCGIPLFVVDHHAVDHILVDLDLLAELEEFAKFAFVRVTFWKIAKI
jgi:hypothetical protein